MEAVQVCICWGGGRVVWQNLGERKQKPMLVDEGGGEGSGGEAESTEYDRMH